MEFRGGIGGGSRQKFAHFKVGEEFPFLALFQFKASSRTVKLGERLCCISVDAFFFVSGGSFYLSRNNCDGKCQLLPLRGTKFVINKWRRFRRASPLGKCYLKLGFELL